MEIASGAVPYDIGEPGHRSDPGHRTGRGHETPAGHHHLLIGPYPGSQERATPSGALSYVADCNVGAGTFTVSAMRPMACQS